jgi:hypothetical protein
LTFISYKQFITLPVTTEYYWGHHIIMYALSPSICLPKQS